MQPAAAKASKGITEEAYAAELQKRDEAAQQLKNKLAHAQGEAERAKHKLDSTINENRIKKREWERERQNMKRQLENSQAEVVPNPAAWRRSQPRHPSLPAPQ